MNGCKSSTEAAAVKDEAPAAAATATSTAGATLTGTCDVVNARYADPSAAGTAVTGAFATVTTLQYTQPAKSSSDNASITFLQSGNATPVWTITFGIDLYTRSGDLARISGSAASQAATDKLTQTAPLATVKTAMAAALYPPAKIGQMNPGYAYWVEVTDYQSGGQLMRADLANCK